jgi:AmmeMemoRadiSam system protein A
MSTAGISYGTLSPDQGQWLLRLARATIAEQLGRPLPQDQKRALTDQLQHPVYACPCGAFVTLTLNGGLRGCIGTLTSKKTLVDNVRENAINAAFHDPRFPPLTPKEYDEMKIEISVLERPRPLAYCDADDLPGRLRPGIDGVILHKGGSSATFLPQVWKQLPRSQDFLSHLCLKAGLPAQAWRDGDLRVETYQVQSFEEGPVA